jgi:hypothetical protein
LFGRGVLVVGTALFLGGCGAATQNVRAFRAYANEEPNVKVSIARVDDVSATLALVDKILTGTSYTPGDQWPRRLGMTDAQFREYKESLANKFPYKGLENEEVPILTCYRAHIEHTFLEYGPPPEKGMYPSLLDAVGALNPRDADIKKHWSAYRDAADHLAAATDEEDLVSRRLGDMSTKERAAHENELVVARDKVARAKGELLAATDQINTDSDNLMADAQLASADKQQIARDAFYALSVAFRVELEALALIPIIIIQTVRGLPTAPHDLTFKSNLKIARMVWEMPSYVVGIKNSLNRQAELLDKMTSNLAKALKTDVDKSPGFELTESVVDQIVGITLDSFRVDVKAGANALIFSSIGEADRQGKDEDFRGRKFKLDYRVDPIILAQARLDVVLDWIRLPGAANVGFGYSTDRVWKSGGEIKQSSLTQQLGITGIASDVIDAGLGLLGVQTSVTVANFTAGNVHEVQATNINNVIASAPLKLKMTQIDVGYDLLWIIENEQIKAYTENIIVGARYYQYTLPRIVYELEDTGTGTTASGAQKAQYTFERESPAQPVESKFYMIAGSVRFGQGEAPRWSPYLDLGFATGAGPVNFYFTDDPTQPNHPHDNAREVAFGLNGVGALGLRWRLLPRGSRVRLDLRGEYRGSLIYTIVNRDQTKDGHALRTDFGQFDVFHGPTVSLRGAL